MQVIYMMVTLMEPMDEDAIEDMQVELEEKLNREFNRRNRSEGAHTIEVDATEDVREHERAVQRVLERAA